jgi:DNA-binding GntR family transcriptional regulator
MNKPISAVRPEASRSRAAARGGKNPPLGEKEAEEPLYQRIAQSLRKDILEGLYPVGSQIPTEAELCERFSVSRYTVREALRRLRDDNLVSSRPRAGTIVMYRPSADAYAQDVMSIEDLVSWSADKRFVIDSIELTEIDGRLAWTGLTAGERWLAVRGYGHTAGVETPHCWSEYYIHRNYAAVGRLLPRHTGPIFPLIEGMFGQTIMEVHQEISATLIPAELAAGLKVREGSAGLRVKRAFTTSDGTLAQVTFTVHPAESFSHSMTMRRIKV